MIPVNNLTGIILQEESFKDNHIIIFLLIKPSDTGGKEILEHFNYLHQRAGKYCNIYPIGYSYQFTSDYPDFIEVKGINNTKLYYSDKCFCEFTDEISKRLGTWTYKGDKQLVILQNNVDGKKDKVCFSNYLSIDITEGLQKGYIDSFPKFMERIIVASKSEVNAKDALVKANRNRYSCNSIIRSAISECPHLPKSLKKIMADKVFFMNKK